MCRRGGAPSGTHHDHSVHLPPSQRMWTKDATKQTRQVRWGGANADAGAGRSSPSGGISGHMIERSPSCERDSKGNVPSVASPGSVCVIGGQVGGAYGRGQSEVGPGYLWRVVPFIFRIARNH